MVRFLAFSGKLHGEGCQGCGIPGYEASKIFDPYFTTKPADNGSGPPSADSIIQKRGGHIGVSATVGRGTIFATYLPSTGQRYAKQLQAFLSQNGDKNLGYRTSRQTDERE